MTRKAVILCAATLSICPAFSDFYVVSHPLPTVFILIPLYVAAILLHYHGDHAHIHSSLAFLDSSAVPNPMLMNQSNLSNTQGQVIPLVAVLLLSKFLH